MVDLVRIEDETITVNDFLKALRFTGKYDSFLEEFVRERVVVKAALQSGLTVADAEVQERADQIRRVMGLHRAADMLAHLEKIKAGVEDFAAFVTHMLLHEKKEQEVTNEAAVAEYFKLHSPKFDAVEIAHIVMPSEGAAREILAMVEDDPTEFGALAAAHSIAESRHKGGVIGTVSRGSLESDNEREAKIFNAGVNVPLGPFATSAGNEFEIFMVLAKHPAVLDESTRTQVKRVIFENWVTATAREMTVELL